MHCSWRLPVPWSSSRSGLARRRFTSENETGPKSYTVCRGRPPRLRHDLACVTVPAGCSLHGARTLKLSSSGDPFARGWDTLLSVHSLIRITESLWATPTHALAAEARLASLRPHPSDRRSPLIGSTALCRPQPDRCTPARHHIWRSDRRDRSPPRHNAGALGRDKCE